MARFVKKLGQQQLRYQFDLTIHEVCMQVPYEVSVSVVWKKDNKRLETKGSPMLGKEKLSADFGGEKMSMISSLFKD